MKASPLESKVFLDIAINMDERQLLGIWGKLLGNSWQLWLVISQFSLRSQSQSRNFPKTYLNTKMLQLSKFVRLDKYHVTGGIEKGETRIDLDF
jgi:hypothetical protein